MAATHRLTVRSLAPDPRSHAIADAAIHLGYSTRPESIDIADVFFVQLATHVTADELSATLTRLADFLVDPLLQEGSWSIPSAPGDLGHWTAVEIAFLPGVTDHGAANLARACELMGIPASATATARRVTVAADETVALAIVERVVANPIIERWTVGPIEPTYAKYADAHRAGAAESIVIAGLSLDQLEALGRERSLALDPAELVAIQTHFAEAGRAPTDVELETLAQTWSEHCAHKTFRAELNGVGLTGVGERPSLLTQLRECTEKIAAPFVRSAFVGDAGIVSFDTGTPNPNGEITIALKAETHNHPSAVEPFGGANTGVGGVIRDVLGSSHRPIAVTDILCFGPPDTSPEDVPAGALHPLRIREGVIEGVADYGNKIGLPTVAGAVLYDPAFTTNPLVFAGCIGVAQGWTDPTGPFPGDRVVVVGGRTGRDGIRGATFSSLTMDATTGEVAGASVQIGDPIIEKLVIDALVGAEHLYSAITDCGAGGLSSSIGEMADGVGADVELDLVPLKYTGLEPWEIWLSEAQERMVVAVPPQNMAALQQRCDHVGVEMADLGTFTGDGRLVVRSHGVPVLDLDTSFLHDGRPRRQMTVEMPRPDRDTPASPRSITDFAGTLLDLLGHRNIASKVATLHRYDHEIRGATAVRPVVGVKRDAHADGVVLAEPGQDEPSPANGIAIGIGVNPWYGLVDPERMAYAVVDEAIRNVVAVGADPTQVALLDNFSFGDPRRPSTLGDLVAAVDGCCEAAFVYQAPFVSGKDSLNNEYTGNDGARHAVPPTLVITAVAHVPDADKCVTPVLSTPGNVLLLLGRTLAEYAGSHLDMVLADRGVHPEQVGPAPSPDPDAPTRYARLHNAIKQGLVRSCHDVAEGGVAVALAEMCIAGRLGATIDHLPGPDAVTAMFAESTGRLVIEVAPGDVDAVIEIVGADDLTQLGVVADTGVLSFPDGVALEVDTLVDVFTRGDA